MTGPSILLPFERERHHTWTIKPCRPLPLVQRLGLDGKPNLKHLSLAAKDHLQSSVGPTAVRVDEVEVGRALGRIELAPRLLDPVLLRRHLGSVEGQLEVL